jgi:4'-phosphopantetheinyl transferase
MESTRLLLAGRLPARKMDLPAALRPRVEAWLVPLDTTESLAWAEDLLSQEEQTRASRFIVQSAQRRFVQSHAALRCILSQHAGCEPAQLHFGQTDKGKPFLIPQNPDGLQFNLSHSADLALIAVAPGLEIGVDLEHVQERPDLHGIAERFWAPAERDALRQAPPTEQRQIFYRLWTRKEAVLKASGQGITAGLHEPDISAAPLTGSPGTELRVQLAGAHWLLFDLDPGPEYAAALALREGW